ncbi:hypothetical protein M2437_000770 [Methylorubrum pseudosasae]|nr:hypothetical protein [Methylorubrum pseudosasae]
MAASCTVADGSFSLRVATMPVRFERVLSESALSWVRLALVSFTRVSAEPIAAR